MSEHPDLTTSNQLKNNEQETSVKVQTVDVLIVGAGAAGLAAGIFTAEANPSLSVLILEGASRVGTKILVSGGGRCNVTHDRIDSRKDFNGPKNPVRNILRAFDEHRTVKWFESMGVKLKTEETGKLFPISNQARDVVNALLYRCDELGVQIRPKSRVLHIDQIDVHGDSESGQSIWRASGQFGAVKARKIVLATGGKSLPKSGSDGYGWEMLKKLGHTITPTCQALVPMNLHPGFFHKRLSGVSLPVTITVIRDGARVYEKTGDLLFTHFGLSGPVVMDASRHWVMESEDRISADGTDDSIEGAKGRGRKGMRLNLIQMRFEEADQWLVNETTHKPKQQIDSILAQQLPRSVGCAVLEKIGIRVDTLIGQLKKVDRRVLSHALTEMELPVTGPRGWNYAEVTAGGVPMTEVDFRNMRSRLVEDLYLVGELLDVDGRIGGYNFQWAWATGYQAGQALGHELSRQG